MEGERETPAKWQDELYELLRRDGVTLFAMCRMPATAY